MVYDALVNDESQTYLFFQIRLKLSECQIVLLKQSQHEN